MDDMEEHDLKAIGTYLVGIAKEAGKIITGAKRTSLTPTTKKNSLDILMPSADIVTETDQAVESFIRERLRERYPTFAFVGEETNKPGDSLTEEPTFIVDPIDGTSNFVHGLPDVCVSIGLVIEKQPIIGVVYNPFHEELWNAVKGHGAFYQRSNGPMQRLPLTSTPLNGLRPSCIGVEWGSDRSGPNFSLNLHVFATLARTTTTGGRFVNSLRCTGSAAITICRVATGQQDAFWECGCWAWDVAAAWCVLVEAGGVMVDGHPGNWSPTVDNRRYLAVRPALDGRGQREFVEEFWGVVGEGRSSYGPPN